VKAIIKLILLTALCGITLNAETFQKPDIARFFDQLENKGHVSVVTIGGSITAHRTGWAQRLVKKIRDAYPQTDVNFINAGISGTGSNLALFRLDRDVIAYRPDLVVIEFAVNDRGTPDEACLRNLESIVVRLRKLPQPPAIVFLESAARTGVEQARHNRIAAHYNILDVDTQHVVDTYLAQHKLEWNALYSDEVHPREDGHELYATSLWNEMQANHRLPVGDQKLLPLPPPVLENLILAPSLITPNFQNAGWDYLPEPTRGWFRHGFFQCSLQSSNEADSLHIPFYGRTIGIALLTLEARGMLRIAVDGQMIKEMRASHPSWYYSFFVHNELLSDGWHTLSLIPVSKDEHPAKIRIAYLMAEDPSKAPEPDSDFWGTTWIASKKLTTEMTGWDWQTIPTENWQLIGPFGTESDPAWAQPEQDLNKDFGPEPATLPPAAKSFIGYNGQIVRAQTATGQAGWVDLKSMYGLRNRGVAYAYTSVHCDKPGYYTFRIALDYFAHVYVNGERVDDESLLKLHGPPQAMVPLNIPLREGANIICVKMHAGSTGFGFRMEHSKTPGIQPTLRQMPTDF